MEENKKKRRYAAEFRKDAVRLVVEKDQPVRSIAADLDVGASTLAKWVQQARADRGEASSSQLTSDEKEELRRLRKENKILQMERDILKKATAFFAKENP